MDEQLEFGSVIFPSTGEIKHFFSNADYVNLVNEGWVKEEDFDKSLLPNQNNN